MPSRKLKKIKRGGRKSARNRKRNVKSKMKRGAQGKRRRTRPEIR